MESFVEFFVAYSGPANTVVVGDRCE